jgi:hypothetical protein
MQTEVEEVSDGPIPFDKEAWIEKGRKYPEHARDVPPAMSYTFKAYWASLMISKLDIFKSQSQPQGLIMQILPNILRYPLNHLEIESFESGFLTKICKNKGAGHVRMKFALSRPEPLSG